jgi:hypothetical protein
MQPKAPAGYLFRRICFIHLYHPAMLSVIITILLEAALEAILLSYFFLGLQKTSRKGN